MTINASDIYEAIYEQFDYIGPDGRSTEHRLHFERLADDERLYKNVTQSLGVLALKFQPDAITFVSEEAHVFAKDVATAASLQFIDQRYLTRQPRGTDDTWIFGKADRELIKSNRIVILDFESFTLEDLDTFLGENPAIAEKAVGFAAVWRRGVPGRERRLSIPRSYLVEMALYRKALPARRRTSVASRNARRG